LGDLGAWGTWGLLFFIFSFVLVELVVLVHLVVLVVIFIFFSLFLQLLLPQRIVDIYVCILRKQFFVPSDSGATTWWFGLSEAHFFDGSKLTINRIRPKIPNTLSRESDFARSRHNLYVSYFLTEFRVKNLEFKIQGSKLRILQKRKGRM
jgi:hypothetical protein